MINSNIVTISHVKKITYPDSSTLFRPSQFYPEYPFSEISKKSNEIYDAVRNTLYMLELDVDQYGSKNWNPLGDIIHQGDNVLIKPNMVMDINHNNTGGTLCLYSQPSVVAAIVDYICIALNGTGKIVIGDAPMQSCDFTKLCKDSGYDDMIRYYQKKDIDISLVDFRGLISTQRKGIREEKIIDSSIGCVVDLGINSEFYGIDENTSQRLRVTSYDPRILPQHHNGAVQEYFISKTVLNADVIINMPKPKTHRKAGFTAALKNFVGINVRKEYLPHHTEGDSAHGGDEYRKYSSVQKIEGILLDKKNMAISEHNYRYSRFFDIGVSVCRLLRKKSNYSEGSWYGNHTISRTITDLNKIVLYADKEGKMQKTEQRKILNVADMIISGEKEGPVAPSPKEVGMIIASQNPIYLDYVVCELMGFEPRKIPTLQCVIKNEKHLYSIGNTNPEDIILKSNKIDFNKKKVSDIIWGDFLKFEPTLGWKGHIERDT